MCGIAGFVSRDEHRDLREAGSVLESMCRVISHRGPDDQGTLVTDRVALGMRRLSIIDLAGGQQPMSGCDSAITLVFNGEIYNYRDLQRELESRGHRFKSRSDTETIVHAYEEYGTRCVDYLSGMFALAIWDAPKRELFVARDRAGKKPLYYTITSSGTLVFGSELKSLREHPEFRGEISIEALDAYLTFGYVPDPLTIFRDFRLPPGHHLTFKDGRVRRQYWDFPSQQPQENPARGEDDYSSASCWMKRFVRVLRPDVCLSFRWN
jgi:asparagine synthase (glutamine-hydrolysing)